jgi:hypothetical protein
LELVALQIVEMVQIQVYFQHHHFFQFGQLVVVVVQVDKIKVYNKASVEALVEVVLL